MTKSRFTKNKQTVRDLQGELIVKCFNDQLGKLSYFGLPSPEMKDIIDWQSFFSYFEVVERGLEPDEWKDQHLLLVNAYKNNIIDRMRLLRGDLDKVILNGVDVHSNHLAFPFNVISLDYSGGLLYRDESGTQYRLKAIKKLIEEQDAKYIVAYLLFISTNLHYSKDGEIVKTLNNIRTELNRSKMNGDEVINAYLSHEMDEMKLKIYIPYYINQIAAGCLYNCVSDKPIVYNGNKGTRMMNFRFYLKYDGRTSAPRFPRERLSQIINTPLVEINDGIPLQKSYGLPKIRVL